MIRLATAYKTLLPCLFSLALSAACPSSGKPVPASPDATKLKTGVFRYRTLVDGKEAGQAEITIRRSDDSDFHFSNRVLRAFSQSWDAVATGNLKPVSAKLAFGEGSTARTIFSLEYQGQHVKGSTFSGKPPAPTVQHPVDEQIAADTVDQRIDWASVMSLGLDSCKEYSFHVYDPQQGNSPVMARVKGPEITKVPAGSYETVRIVYTITKKQGPETFQVLVSRSNPRFLVREEFPNGSAIELTEVRGL